MDDVQDPAPVQHPVPSRAVTARAYLVYTGLRLAVFVGTAALLFLVVRVNGLPLLLGALLVSSIASLFLLRRQRDALVLAQERRGEARRAEKQRLREQLDGEPGRPGP